MIFNNDEPIETKWMRVRMERAKLLSEFDRLAWIAMLDGDDAKLTNLKQYRRKLLDLPATNSDPTKLVWPAKPQE